MQTNAKNRFTVALGYRPPYEWERILGFLALRALPGVETVSKGTFHRTIRLTDKNGRVVSGWISVSIKPEKNVLAVTLSDSLLPVLPQALGRIRNLFDLHCDPQAVNDSFTAVNGQIPGAFVCGIRVPGCVDPFELCVRAILGQQITVKAAGTLAGKFAQVCGFPIETGVGGLTTVFPSAEEIVCLHGPIENHLGPLGIITSRAKAIQSLATMVAKKEIDFGNDPEIEIKKMIEIPGVGAWTATYIAMRALGWTDAFLETDLGIRKALGNKKPNEIRKMSGQWKPWRSYATMALWDSLHVEKKI